jgi:hypothetical protein
MVTTASLGATITLSTESLLVAEPAEFVTTTE